jgi:hypothetical protein
MLCGESARQMRSQVLSSGPACRSAATAADLKSAQHASSQGSAKSQLFRVCATSLLVRGGVSASTRARLASFVSACSVMKLDVSVLRYLSHDEWRTLTAVELGQKNVRLAAASSSRCLFVDTSSFPPYPCALTSAHSRLYTVSQTTMKCWSDGNLSFLRRGHQLTLLTLRVVCSMKSCRQL